MKPKPLHRSLTFWSGVFILLSFVWMMWDSMRAETGLRVGSASCINRYGAVFLGYETERMPADFFRFDRDPHLYTPSSVNPFPAPRFGWPREEEHPWERAWTMVLPHWLLMLAAALPWLTLCVRRDRRIRRAVTGTLSRP